MQIKFALAVLCALALLGCKDPHPPMTSAELIEIAVSCRAAGLGTHTIKHYYSTAIIGAQCDPSNPLPSASQQDGAKEDEA